MIKKKNYLIDDKTYIFEQPSAIKALAMSALCGRIVQVINAIESQNHYSIIDDEQYEKDLNGLLKNNAYLMIVTGTSDKGLPQARMITLDSDLPSSIVDLSRLIGEFINYLFEVDPDLDNKDTGEKPKKK